MVINKNKVDSKFEAEWKKEISMLSPILDGAETDDNKKESKKLEKLLAERVAKGEEVKQIKKEIRKLKDEDKSLKNATAYHRQAEKQLTRLRNTTNKTTHDARQANFLGTGATKYRTNGWLANANAHFTPTSGKLDNLYQVKLASGDVAITEEQFINTVARVVKALEKVDAGDFETKYNAKESDTTKQGQAKILLKYLQDQAKEIRIGSDQDKDGNKKQPSYDFAHNYQNGKWDNAGNWVPNTTAAFTQTGFDYKNFFDFIALTQGQAFLNDLDADKQKNVDQTSSWQIFLKGEAYEPEKLKDYGLEIDPVKTTLYKTSEDDKKTISVGNGVAGWLELGKTMTAHSDNQTKIISAFNGYNSPNQQLLTDLKTWTQGADGYLTDGTNYTLPENEDSMEEVVDELKNKEQQSAVLGAELIKEIRAKEKEIKAKQVEINGQETQIEVYLTKILTKKREELGKYNITKGFKKVSDTDDNRRETSELWTIQNCLLTIRYLENDGDATKNSSKSEEDAALTEIDGILDKVGYSASPNCHLVSYFSILGDDKVDIQQAIERIKAGKYTDGAGQEHNVALFGNLEKFKTHFENKEQEVKLNDWETKALAAIRKALSKEDNANEKLTDWQSKLKALDPALDDTVITEEFKTKWSEIGNHQKISQVEALIKKIFGTDGKVKTEFLTEIKKSDATLVDLKTLLQQEPKKIITYIARYEYNNLDDSAAEEKKKLKTQMTRKIKKLLGKTGANIDKDLTDEEINTALYEVAIGTKTLSANALKADLSEFITETPTNNGNPNETKQEWYEKGYYAPIWGSALAIVGVLAIIFRKTISEWWTGPVEEKIAEETEGESSASEDDN